MGANISIKLQFLYSYLDRFPENLGDLSEQQGERFYQDISEMVLVCEDISETFRKLVLLVFTT